MPRFKGRSASACYYCRSQKVKCSGEHPCSKCRAAHRDCIFPSKDRVLTVPESYMRRLENEISLLRSKQSGEGASSQTHGEPEPARNERLIEDSTTEHFIGKLKGVYSATATQSDPFPRTSTIARASPLCDTTSSYTYIPLGSDTSQTEVFVKLPPHSYAVYLLSQFETFIGSDYHWYRKQHFRARMEATYNAAQAQSVDRTWLCCLSVVLALGESYNDSFAPAFSVDGNEGVTVDNQVIQNEHPVAPPGIKLFEQGLQLLKLTYEQPTVEQIEALNLITFYCYSLNRKKTAYAYAGMALRLAKLLGIPKLSQTHVDLVEQEHRKRVWWTTICMDLMTCTELSLTPAHRFDDRSPESPDSKHLSTDDMEEFSDPQYLAAQVKLCRIKYSILETASESGTGNMREAHMLIQPWLQALRRWRMEFLPSLDFTEDGGFSNVTLALPEMRTIASLLLRYNQCYILLLRPLLLRQLYSIVQENALLEPNSELASLNTECLRAATDNARIQHALSKCHRIAKFGFWESLHIFSSLTIHVMANFIKEKCPNAFSDVSDDSSYGPARDVLRQMAQAGNAASQDHERMIEDIENMFTIDSAHAGSTQSIEDLIGWSNYLDSGNADLDLGLLGAFSS